MSAESSAPKESSVDSKIKSPPSTASVSNVLGKKGGGLSKFRNATKKISHELEYQRLFEALENTKMPALLSKLRDATNKDCTWRTSMDILNICALASLVTPYFAQHSLCVKMELCANMKLETFRKNQYVCKQNELGEDFYIIASGAVEVQVKSQYDEQKIEKLALLKVGSAFGEMALLSEAPRCASCLAVRVSDILTIDKATFLKVFEDKQAMFNAEGQAFLKEEVHAFKTATETELSQFAKRIALVHFPKDYVFNLDGMKYVYFIKSGILGFMIPKGSSSETVNARHTSLPTAPVRRKPPKPEECVPLAKLGPGQFFGEGLLWEHMKRGWIGAAETDLTLYQASAEHMQTCSTEVAQCIHDEAEFRYNYYSGKACLASPASGGDRDGRSPPQPEMEVPALDSHRLMRYEDEDGQIMRTEFSEIYRDLMEDEDEVEEEDSLLDIMDERVLKPTVPEQGSRPGAHMKHRKLVDQPRPVTHAWSQPRPVTHACSRPGGTALETFDKISRKLNLANTAGGEKLLPPINNTQSPHGTIGSRYTAHIAHKPEAPPSRRPDASTRRLAVRASPQEPVPEGHRWAPTSSTPRRLSGADPGLSERRSRATRATIDTGMLPSAAAAAAVAAQASGRADYTRTRTPHSSLDKVCSSNDIDPWAQPAQEGPAIDAQGRNLASLLVEGRPTGRPFPDSAARFSSPRIKRCGPCLGFPGVQREALAPRSQATDLFTFFTRAVLPGSIMALHDYPRN
ncbi:hypothetical protein CYMTET_48460 [Cymbomonas tetramitiformis]|uniref:Cyclic nucleotide-binding domain-containing protein n=1 Tax=Cymbomonas tetramitiformis TaxID=36881 RepID=A0AAE0EVQ8_9CHLO|nr:hypothetical protein CYMTET_48460 [Cymbomonas tetramitiformis]